MNFVLQPWHFLLAILTGWVNEHSRRQIDYLHTEVTILKESFGTKRPRLTNDQRRRLAAKGKPYVAALHAIARHAPVSSFKRRAGEVGFGR